MITSLVKLFKTEAKWIVIKFILGAVPLVYFVLNSSDHGLGTLLGWVATVTLLVNIIAIGVVVAIQDSKIEIVRRRIISWVGLALGVSSLIALGMDSSEEGVGFMVAGSLLSCFPGFARLVRSDFLLRTGGQLPFFLFVLAESAAGLDSVENWLLVNVVLFIFFMVVVWPRWTTNRLSVLCLCLVKRAWRANILRGIASNASKRGEGALLGVLEPDQFITIKIIRYFFSLSQTLSVFVFDVLRTSNFSNFSLEHVRPWVRALSDLTSNCGTRLALSGLSGSIVFCCWYLLGNALGLAALPILFTLTFVLQQVTAPMLAFLYQKRANAVLNWLAFLSFTYIALGVVTVYLGLSASSIQVAGVLFGGSLASHVYLVLALRLPSHRD